MTKEQDTLLRVAVIFCGAATIISTLHIMIFLFMLDKLIAKGVCP